MNWAGAFLRCPVSAASPSAFSPGQKCAPRRRRSSAIFARILAETAWDGCPHVFHPRLIVHPDDAIESPAATVGDDMPRKKSRRMTDRRLETIRRLEAIRRLESRAVLVTGAAGGIGQATARRLASEGARLALADRDAAG